MASMSLFPGSLQSYEMDLQNRTHFWTKIRYLWHRNGLILEVFERIESKVCLTRVHVQNETDFRAACDLFFMTLQYGVVKFNFTIFSKPNRNFKVSCPSRLPKHLRKWVTLTRSKVAPEF